MARKIKAVILDFFGTLVASGDPECEAIKKFGLKQHFTEVQSVLCGKTAPRLTGASVRDIAKRLGIEAKKENLNRLRKILEKQLKVSKPFADAEKTLRLLKKKGYKLGIVSNSWNAAVEKIKKGYHIIEFFDYAVFSHETMLFKPGSETYRKCLKGLGVKAENAIMVGDSLRTDIIGAGKAGLKGILLNRAGKKIDSKEPVAIISSLKELPEKIELL